jgi:hypothetical protein
MLAQVLLSQFLSQSLISGLGDNAPKFGVIKIIADKFLLFVQHGNNT